MSGHRFSEQEVGYLKGLPAVANATTARIVYSPWFKRDCLKRYRAGESATRLFRAAGLPPELVGRKRIERAISRWRRSEPDPGKPGLEEPAAGGYPAGTPDATDDGDGEMMKPGFDVRDILIVQQIRRIAELERQVDALRVAITAGQARDEDGRHASTPSTDKQGEPYEL